MALAMLRHAGAPKVLVEFSLNHAILLLNRLPRNKKGKGLIVPLELWLGLKPPSILHVLKVWGCAAYALELGQRGKFDAKVTKLVHLGYDVARCSYILCSLPHFKISFSAHVTFNEDDFPFRGLSRADPVPFKLFEEQAGREFRHAASGEAWGSFPLSERKPVNPIDRRLADAHGTLGFGLGLGRVSGQGPSGCRSTPLPLGVKVVDSPQTPLVGEVPGKRPRVGASRPD